MQAALLFTDDKSDDTPNTASGYSYMLHKAMGTSAALWHLKISLQMTLECKLGQKLAAAHAVEVTTVMLYSKALK
jgi:hypothetical protein